MNILCFGSFARLLKDATGLTNENLINLLFGGVISSRSTYSTSLGPPDQSKLVNSKLDVPLYIKEPADTPAVIGLIEGYFREHVVTQIKASKTSLLLSLLTDLIKADSKIPATDKANFLSSATVEQFPSFLSNTFLYALQQPNNLSVNPLSASPVAGNFITIAEGKIFVNGEELNLPKKLKPPESLEPSESAYIAELLLAYAEADGIDDMTVGTIPPKYQRNFIEQRQNYFNAEAVRRRVRDVFPADRDEFEILKNDTYDGIIDIYSQDWTHGYERLLKVLAQVALVRIEKSLLGSQLTWIGSSEKKGVCHILVNEGRLKWVVKNE